MIITLYIYHAYETNVPDQAAMENATKNKNVAISFLYISRFLSGFSAGSSQWFYLIRSKIYCLGMCCVVSTSYLNEISPRALRGTVGSCHQLALVIGILIGQIVGLPWLLGRHK